MSAETRTTSSSGGEKGVKIERFDLIPVGPLTELAAHFGRGAAKYDDNQWRKGYEWSKSYAAKQRHDNLFWAGFDYDVCENDPEGCAFVTKDGDPFSQFESEHGHGCYNHTTSHHLDASNWHGFVLREFTVTHPEHDDRYRPPVEEVPEWRQQLVFWLSEVVYPNFQAIWAREVERQRALAAYSIPVRFIAGIFGTEDIQVKWRDPEPMTPDGIAESRQQMNDALNRHD